MINLIEKIKKLGETLLAKIGNLFSSYFFTGEKAPLQEVADKAEHLYPQLSPPSYEVATGMETAPPAFYPGHKGIGDKIVDYSKALFQKVIKPGERPIGLTDIAAYATIAVGLACVANLVSSSIKTICCLLFVGVTLSVLASYNKARTATKEVNVQQMVEQPRLLS